MLCSFVFFQLHLKIHYLKVWLDPGSAAVWRGDWPGRSGDTLLYSRDKFHQEVLLGMWLPEPSLIWDLGHDLYQHPDSDWSRVITWPGYWALIGHWCLMIYTNFQTRAETFKIHNQESFTSAIYLLGLRRKFKKVLSSFFSCYPMINNQGFLLPLCYCSLRVNYLHL